MSTSLSLAEQCLLLSRNVPASIKWNLEVTQHESAFGDVLVPTVILNGQKRGVFACRIAKVFDHTLGPQERTAALADAIQCGGVSPTAAHCADCQALLILGRDAPLAADIPEIADVPQHLVDAWWASLGSQVNL